MLSKTMTESLSKGFHLSFAWVDLQSRLHMNLHKLMNLHGKGRYILLYLIMLWNSFLMPSFSGGAIKGIVQIPPIRKVRRKWQPTPVFLPGESQGRGSLVGCHLWGHTESDTTEVTYSSSSSLMLQPSYGDPQLGRNNPLCSWILGETKVLGPGLGSQTEKGTLRVFWYFNTSIGILILIRWTSDLYPLYSVAICALLHLYGEDVYPKIKPSSIMVNV